MIKITKCSNCGKKNNCEKYRSVSHYCEYLLCTKWVPIKKPANVVLFGSNISNAISNLKTFWRGNKTWLNRKRKK